MTNSNNFMAHNKDIVGVFAITGAILLLPLLAMQVTDEVQWSAFDFIFMGCMLLATGTLLVVASRKISSPMVKLSALMIILAVFMVLWIHAAVGIVDSWPLAGS